MDNQSQEIVDLLREQNQLLKKHLWRLRFSLASLLLLTTVACLMLGYIMTNYVPSPIKSRSVATAVPAPAATFASDLPEYYRSVAPQLVRQRYPRADAK